jgi:hypothetical protein
MSRLATLAYLSAALVATAAPVVAFFLELA